MFYGCFIYHIRTEVYACMLQTMATTLFKITETVSVFHINNSWFTWRRLPSNNNALLMDPFGSQFTDKWCYTFEEFQF